VLARRGLFISEFNEPAIAACGLLHVKPEPFQAFPLKLSGIARRDLLPHALAFVGSPHGEKV
jgi:hypothetical protein